jgi:Family of unknown function (DUF6527)
MALGRRLRWWHTLPRRKWRLVLLVDEADEVPERLPHNTAALVGPAEQPKWIAFDCPCRRRHRIMLNLDRRRLPAWSLVSQQPLTLSPSIDDYAMGRCHFFLRQGRIKWAPSRTEVDR